MPSSRSRWPPDTNSAARASVSPSTPVPACVTTSNVHEELTTETADGVELRLDRVPAMDARRGVVVCLHAMMTDGRYFGARRDDGFAMELAETGLEVYVADFRGHGRSVPPFAGVDDWCFDDLVELDLPAIVAAVCTRSRCTPGEVSILGHSLGGLV